MSEPEQLGAELLLAIARIHRWATGQADLPVPVGRARLLALVDNLGPSRVSDLARADHSSQPTMTTQLNRLETDGLVRRDPDPQDARAQRISLTDAGAAVLAATRRARQAVIAPHIDALPEPDRRRLAEAIRVLTELTDSLPPIRAPHSGPSPTAPVPPATTQNQKEHQ